jgi:hypothetical protein
MDETVIQEQLLSLLRGGNAHMTFEEAVASFPPEEFNIKPPNVPYSFWHLLEHIRIAQWDILEFVLNPDHESPVWPAGYWPGVDETANQGKWEASLGQIKADMNACENLVTNPPFPLTAPIPHAPDYTVFREILVLSDHNAYHIGEFGILRGVLDLW